MQKVYSVLLSLFWFSASMYAEAVSGENKSYEIYFSCGAVYNLYRDVSREINDNYAYNYYRLKYSRISDVAEQMYVSSGYTKTQAKTYMQSHADVVVNLFLTDRDAAADMKRKCDLQFPS